MAFDDRPLTLLNSRRSLVLNESEGKDQRIRCAVAIVVASPRLMPAAARCLQENAVRNGKEQGNKAYECARTYDGTTSHSEEITAVKL